MRNRFFLTGLLALILGFSVPAHDKAQGGPEPGVGPGAEPQPDPGAQPGVGRVSVVHGDVATRRGGSGEWVSSTVNTPVSPGDSVGTSDKSLAEVQLDFANVLHLDERTEVKVVDLEARRMQIQVASGGVNVTVFKGSEADIEIDTPNMAVHPLLEGIYRIQVDSATQTQLIVRQGEAEVLTQQGSQKVERDQVMFIQGSDNPEYRIDRAPGRDDFDKWTNDRDRQIGNAQAYAHTDRYYTGSSDLDTSGQWENVPGYDWCWTPAVDAGWVPYRDGRWGYEPYWGWTWISAEPWGWAPYHYGRWLSYGGRWRWWPGVGIGGVRPMWGPAYVSFLGFGRGGFGIGAAGLGFASIGWLPLGPRDGLHPWWGRGHGFSVTNFNDFHGRGGAFTSMGGRPFGSNLEAVMHDEHMRGAITNVSSRDFASGHMGHFQPVSEGMLRGASMVRGSVPVVPTRESLGSRANGRANFTSSAMNGQHFYSRSAAPMGRPSNFNAGGGYTGNLRSNTTAGERMAGPGGQGNPAWQRFNSTNQSGRWPSSVNLGGTRGGEMSAAGRPGYSVSPQRTPNNWQRFNTQPRAPMGGVGPSRSFESRSGGPGGWNALAPRSGSARYGYAGSRPPIQLNRPVMRERSSGGGGGQAGGGGHSYSAPHGGGGGGGSHGGGGGGVSSHGSGGGGGSHGGKH